MSKQTVRIGGRDVELDLLTKEEVATTIEELVSGYLRPPASARPEGGAQLTGTTGVAEIYVVPVGMQFRLTRVFVTVNNATFGVPVASAGGIDVYRGQGNANDPIDGIPFTSLPQVGTWNRANGPLFKDGEAFRVGIVGAPNNAQLFVRAAGFLEPLVIEGVAT